MVNKDLNKTISKCEAELGFWEQHLANIESFKDEDGYTSLFKFSWKPNYDVENKIARIKAKLNVMRAFASLSGGESNIKFSNYFEIQCNEFGIGFNLTNEIESDVYNYVYNSYSDLYIKVNEKLITFLAPVINYNTFYEWSNNNLDLDLTINCFKYIDEKTKSDIDRASYRYNDDIKKLIKKLQSEEIKPYIELAEKYIDLLVERGKQEDE